MESFRMKLAGIAFEVNCSYYSTKEYCASYFTEDAPLFVLNITQEDIEHEHSLLDYPASAPYAEQLAVYRAICEKLCAYDIFLLHGSAIAVDGETYIFIAPSGTGKSTHTALWRKALQGQHDIVMVNDDKPLIQVTKNGVFACGTPWSGTYGLNTDVSLPVKAICVLHRDTENHIEPLAKDKAFLELYQRVYLPHHTEGMQRVLALLNQTMRMVRFWSLGCNITVEAALTAYHAMKKGNNT